MKRKAAQINNTISNYRRNFYNIYHTNIVPILNEFESNRKKELLKLILIELLICGFVFWYWYLFFSSGYAYKWMQNPFFFGIIFAAKISVIYLPFHFNNKFVKSLKLQCMDKIAKGFGNLSWYDCCELISNSELNKSQLFASYNRRIALDAFKGKYKDVTFQISETQMYYESGSGRSRTVVTIFRGVIVKFKANKTIKAPTIIATKGDHNIKNNNKYFWIPILVLSLQCYLMLFDGEASLPDVILCLFIISIPIAYLIFCIVIGNRKINLEEIKLEDPEFTKKYRAYSTDQVEGRYLITPAFMERFKNIQTAFGTNKVKCSFYDDNLMFAISTDKNLFEIGNLFFSLNNPKQMTKFFEELSSILALIDYFKLDEKTKL